MALSATVWLANVLFTGLGFGYTQKATYYIYDNMIF